jgi:hypothetical protein
MNGYIHEVTDEDREDTDVSNKVYATTKGGKDIVISSRHGYWTIKFTTGGQLPAALTDRFTRYEIAAQAVNTYLATEKDAPKRSTKQSSKA